MFLQMGSKWPRGGKLLQDGDRIAAAGHAVADVELHDHARAGLAEDDFIGIWSASGLKSRAWEWYPTRIPESFTRQPNG